MKVVAFSDSHGFLPRIEPCDLLLIAGDICPVGHSHTAIEQSRWLSDTFRTYLKGIPAKEIVLIAGNHDWTFEDNSYPKDLPCHYLQDESVEIGGLKIYGTPWQPYFFNWAFNLKFEFELKAKWEMIPSDTDILVTHSPPYGVLDISGIDGEHCGSISLYNEINRRIEPKLHVFGHVHGSRGAFNMDPIQFANVTVVNEGYENVYEPMTFEIS